MKKFFCLAFALLFVQTCLLAQSLGTGAYAFASFDHPGFDSINLGNLNTRFTIPIVSRAGRGLSFNYSVQYEGLVWSNTNGVWVPDPAWGFNGVLNGTGFTGYLTYTDFHATCPGPSGNHGGYDDTYGAFVYHDAYGGTHGFDYQLDTHDCPEDDGNAVISGGGASSDGSGYTLLDMSRIQSRDGTIIHPAYSATGASPTSITDRNGNQISGTGSGSFTDTLGVTALTVSGSSSRTFTYPVALQSNSASTAATTLTSHTYTVRTNFQCSGVVEYGSNSVSLPDRVTFADGTFYAFTYEATPSATDGAVTGRLHSVTLPTGGTITYTYSGGCGGSGINADGTVASLSRVTNPGGTRTYTRNVASPTSQTTLTDEKNKVSVYDFVADTTGAFLFETHRSIYDGAATGTPLVGQYTCSNQSLQACSSVITLPITSQWITTSPNGMLQVLVQNSYDGNGTLLTGSNIYGQESSSTTYNDLGEPLTQILQDSNGTTFRQTTYGYDETALTTTSGLPQHTSGASERGNLTSTHVTGSPNINTAIAYNDAGMPVSSTADDGAVTSYTYDSTGAFVQGTTLPTTVVPLSTSASYNANSASLLSSTGLNSGETTTINQYDALLRPTDLTLASGSHVVINRNSTQVGTTQLLDSSTGRTAATVIEVDAYGRTSRTAVATGQGGSGAWYQTDSCYDAVGLLQFESTRYQGSGFGDPKRCSGSGTSYLYDALGRVTQVTTDDGSSQTQYLGRAVKTQDVNGVERITQYDLLGRISGVCEISSSPLAGSTATNCSMDISGSGYVTGYMYSLAGHTTTVSQGSQSRTFVTDAAGRTTSTTEPERGTTTYTYTNGGDTITRTRPKANQTNPSVTTNTVYGYDSLGRLGQVSYDDGTPTKYFYYDAVPSWLNWSSATSNLKGRLSSTLLSGSSYTTKSQYSYDVAGNIVAAWQCAPSICSTSAQEGRPTLQFGYDLAGTLMSYFDGASGNIVYQRSVAEEITSVTNLNYNDTYNPPNLLSTVTNTPFGPSHWHLGNNTSVVQAYDSQGRRFAGWLCSGSGADGQTQYCSGSSQLYGYSTVLKGARVNGMCDSALNLCQGHTYDDFNRLTNVGGTSGPYYTYDRWGNRLSQTGSPSVSFSFDAGNHNTSFSYDAAGNQLNDGVHNYTYDAEGKVVSIDGGATARYIYDASDNRVQTQVGSNTTEYLYDPSGRRTSTWLVGSSFGAAGFGNEGRIYWDGGLLANRAWNGTTYFHHGDWLGTERMRTDYQGNVANLQTSRAFGDGFSQTSSDTYGAAQDNNQFTSQERDAETGTSHFQYRQYASTQASWMSPDRYAGSYDLRNPQSLNRYSYVMNNVYSLFDPYGLDSCYPVYGGGRDVADPNGGVIAEPVGYNCSDSGGTFSPRSPRNSGDNYGGNSSTSSSSNATAKEIACIKEGLGKNAVSLGLDVLGFIPGGNAAALIFQTGVGVASIVNSSISYNPSATGVVRAAGQVGLASTFAGFHVTAIAPAAKMTLRTEAGFAQTFLKSLPAIGTALNVISTGADVISTVNDIRTCMRR